MSIVLPSVSVGLCDMAETKKLMLYRDSAKPTSLCLSDLGIVTCDNIRDNFAGMTEQVHMHGVCTQ